ncbi:MAG: hypothetical protein ABH824_01795 [Nanoarchaeota archaeon]|nr:hypothetical protein [Nanoarchaeota archaeon]MBU1631804.1 hypothetical protein [Nanoarchaeota archaeon]MBU1876596.1 hypothetical protein [Nanoarchaeota archaeon]
MIEKLVSYAALGAALASPLACGDDDRNLCEDYCSAFNDCCNRGNEDFCKELDHNDGYSGCISECESHFEIAKKDPVLKGSLCLYENENSCDWEGSKIRKCLEDYD